MNDAKFELDSFRLDFEAEINDRLNEVERNSKKLTAKDEGEIRAQESVESKTVSSNAWARTDHEIIERMRNEFVELQSLDSSLSAEKDADVKQIQGEGQGGSYSTKFIIILMLLIAILGLKRLAENKESETPRIPASTSEALNPTSSLKPSVSEASIEASKASEPITAGREGGEQFRAFVKNPVPIAK